MIRLLISLFLLPGFSLSFAQELIFEKPAPLTSPPSNETYQIMQDSKGYIWFSTETGLCRYNGQEIKIFRGKEGIPEESCYGIAQDSKGIIYVITSKNRIMKLVNEKFTETPVSKTFAKQMNSVPVFVNSMKISGDSLMIISSSIYGYVINLKKNRMQKFACQSPEMDIDLKEFYGISLPIVSHYHELYHLEKSLFKFTDNKKKLLIRLTIGNQSTTYCLPKEVKERLRHRILVWSDNKGNRIMSMSERLVMLNKDLSVATTNLNKEIISMYIDKSNGLWLGTRAEGLVYYPDGSNIKSKSISALNCFSVAGIMEDKEGNIWCTTLENGVFVCRNKELRRIYDNTYEKNKGPFLTKCLQDSTYIFTANGVVLKSFNDQSDTMGTGLSNQYMTDVVLAGNQWFVSGKTATTLYSYDLKEKRSLSILSGTKRVPNCANNQLLRLKNGRILGLVYTAVSEIFNDETNRHKLETGGIILGMLADREDRTYVYTSEKIFSLDYSDVANFTCKEFAAFPDIHKVMIDTKDRFWIITKGPGLYILRDGKKDSIPIASTKGQIQYYDIFEDVFSNMWLATNFGVLKLSPHREGYRQEWFDQQFGLPETEFHKITGTSSDIVVSTSTGVYKFPLNNRLKVYKARVPVYISSLKVNNKERPIKNRFELDYDQNTIEVKYDVLDYNTLSGAEKLSYKVIGYDEASHELDHSDILLTKLPPGEFQLQVSALDEKGNAVSAINTLYIKINPPFWQKWPFIILTSLLGFALTIYLVYIAVRRSRKKLEEKNQIDKMLSEYQMSALKAQMNPHFIFNCINSIQRYILTNKTSDAYDYLAKFSKLIRLVLNYSEETLITLEEELEICQLYIEMEQIRYEGFFSYEIVCDEDVKADTVTLPSLLMQPYIENAIWHGIMNLQKSREGYLKVHIEMEGENLKITIEDNGVGREESAKVRNRNHKSKALGLNKKRMELINILNNSTHASVVLEDISDAQNTVQGTRVRLTIPQINKND